MYLQSVTPPVDTVNQSRSALTSSGSLVSITKSVNRPLKDPSFSRLDRWALQAAAADLLPKERVSTCLSRVSAFKHPTSANMHNVFELDYFKKVQIQHSKRLDSFYYSNLITCGSVWHCPVCAAKISEQRKNELIDGFSRWRSSGCQVYMLTLTIPHYTRDTLKSTLSGISDALKRLTNSKGFKALSLSIGLQGRIRALEVTYGQNGWHPHFHLLLFLTRQLSPDSLQCVQADLLSLWQVACVRAGLPSPNSHGVNIQDGNYASQYIAKWGQSPSKPTWGIEAEMTKAHIKKSSGGFSPFDLLRNYLDMTESTFNLGSEASVALWKEYAKEFKGKRQLVWSRGLREMLLGESVEISDQDLADTVEPDDQLFAQIPLDIWRVILRRKIRGLVLEKCREGKSALDDFLVSLSSDRVSILSGQHRDPQQGANHGKATI